ncbi:SIR2 family protein [Chloroflexota bacterium]
MWLINNKVFLNDGKNDNRISKAQDDLSNACHNKALTLVLGNGPSQSAVFLDALASKKEPSDAGWASAIIRAARSAGVPKEYISTEYNLLALAQAIFRQEGNIDASRRMIIKELHNEFRRPISSTLIHKLLIDLAPSRIVTTNYDLQIERAFEEQNKPWCAPVRNVQDELPEQLTVIFKMHGTLEPDEKCRDKYRYMNPTWSASPERSVVISETDYDNCLYELMDTSKNTPKSPLFNALRQTCLIIGKSMTGQDLSFLYALREIYDARTANPSYILCTSLTKEENLNLHNLKIEPLLINMPSNPKSGHYYIGAAKALIKLFPEMQEAYQDEIENFAHEYDLLRAPHFVALGLSAHNTTGQIKYAGAGGESKQQNLLPKEGRRNLMFEAEEHAGGSALTALGVFSALDYKNIYSKSLISVTGKREKDIYGRTEKDIFNETVFEFCKSYDIDIDGVSDTASNTWRSVVLIHDSKTHSGSRYPGQHLVYYLADMYGSLLTGIVY